MTTLSIINKQITEGSIVEMKNAYQSFFYKVLEVPVDKKGRFGVLTELGIRYYLSDDFHGISDEFDFSKIIIKEDNIHLYYEFMSDEDIHKHLSIIHFKLKDETIDGLSRGGNIAKALDIKGAELIKNSKVIPHSSGAVTHVLRFGVKDTLKPIDDYILEIKESEAYKAHIHSKFDYYYDSDEDLTEFYINGSIIFDSEGCLDYDECLNAFLNHVSSLCVVDASANSKTEYKDTSKINMYKMPEVDTKKRKI